MAARDDIIAAVRAAADGSGNLGLRAQLGAPGVSILLRGEAVATGQAWAIPGFVDALVTGIGSVVDGAVGGGVAFAVMATNATGLAPTLVRGNRIAAPIPADKDEVNSTLRLRFSTAFAAAPAVVAMLDTHAFSYHTEIVGRAVADCTLAFRDGLSARLSINARTVLAVVAG